MTEQRLYEILNEAHGDDPLHRSHLIIKAMKQAVNEALDEAAKESKVLATKNDRIESVRDAYPHSDGWHMAVDKQSILNLKLK